MDANNKVQNFDIVNKIDTIQELINFYDNNEHFKEYIIKNIEDYFIFKKDNFLKNILNMDDPFYSELGIGYMTDYEEDKDDFLDEINKKFNEHIIYKKIIELTLKCNKCYYIYNTDNIKHIYLCIYCDSYVCKECCINCDTCRIYDNKLYDDPRPNCHCYDCQNKCLNNIEKRIYNENKLKKEDKKEINEIKKLLFKSYEDNLEPEHIKYRKNPIFINNLKISNNIKNFLIRYSNEL